MYYLNLKEEPAMIKKVRKSLHEEEFELDNIYNEDDHYRMTDSSIWYS